jgi:hypothetical protein
MFPAGPVGQNELILQGKVWGSSSDRRGHDDEKPTTRESSAELTLKDIRRATRRQYSAEDKIRIAPEGLRGETSIAELCRKEGIAERRRPSAARWFAT